MSGGIVVVMSGFPRRSETFALNELLGLDARGALAAVFATKPGDDAPLQPGAERLARRVELLPQGSAADQADAVVARVRGDAVRAVHGYFAHEPTEVAMLAARRLGVPYGFSVHARDARKVSPAELGRRSRGAACVVACNPDVAADVRRAGGEARLIPHGVDLKRFAPTPAAPEGPLRLLAVGRLVPKKGFDVLIDACALLETTFRLRIVGEGPERVALESRIAAAGLGADIELAGPRTHAELPAEYARADLVVAPSVADPPSGGRAADRDGLPNVVLEAMASGRTVVASDIGAIAQAVADGDTGLLVPAGDATALAAAIDTLAERPVLCFDLAHAARARVQKEYALDACTDRLHRCLEEAYA